ncbi:MAG: GerW family sporulation protein [Clostridia bacterium]|nr:GerW family sporulation protein [Clostridia bacterium]
MREHPIEGLMSAAMNSIKDMVDVNTIIGDAIETSNNIVIIPISKVCFGFAAGGSEFNEETIDEYTKKEKDEELIKYKLPFGGGAGAGVSINPVAFLIVQEESVKLLPVNHSSTIDRLLDYVPDLFENLGKKICKQNIIQEEIDNLFKKDKKQESKNNKEEQYENEIEYDETGEQDD